MNPKIHPFQRRFLTLLGLLIIVSLMMPALPGAGTVFAQSSEATPQPPVPGGAPAEAVPPAQEPWLDSPPPEEAFIRSVNADDPSLGMIVYQDNIPAATRSVMINDSKAYFGDGARLVIYDVTTPDTPNYLGSSDILAGTLMNLTLRDSVAYLALGTAGVWKMDISTPASLPEEELVYSTPGTAGKLALPDGKPKRIYVAAQSGHLNVLAPQRLSQRRIGVFPVGIASDVEAEGTIAYATDQYDNKLRIIDFSTTWKGKQAGSLAVSGSVNGLTKSGDYVYIASGSEGLRVINVATPSAPAEVGSLSGIGDARDVKVSGNYAYVAAGTNGLKIVDVSNPAAPFLAASYDTPGLAVDVDISGSYVFIADTSSLVILQITGAYSIAGSVTNTATGEGLANVTVSATNNATQLVYYAKSAASTGAYTLSSLPAGTYTLAGSKSGFTVTASFTNPVTVGPNATGKNFTATIASDSYRVSGTIRDASSKPIANISVSDGNGRTSVTDSNGLYELSGLANGTYSIIPTSGTYTFSPASRTVTVSGANIQNQNFSATAIPGSFKISGYVRNSSTTPLAGAIVSDGGSRSATTNSSGYFELSNLPAGSYTLSASKSGYTITPSGWSNPVTISSANRSDVNFTYTESPTPFTVSGTVTDGMAPLSGVQVSASFGESAVSGSDGAYTILNAPTGAYTLSAAKTGFTCTPSSLSGNAPGDVTGKDFVCTSEAYSINGRITDASSNPISGVLLILSNGSTTTTDSNGDFSFSGLQTGSYTVMAFKSGYTFSPSSLTVYVSSEVNLDVTISFTGASSSSGTYTVSGTITDDTGAVAGVTVYASNGLSAVSGASGGYTLSGFPEGSFAVMPASSGYLFTPVTRTVSPSSSSPAITGQDFVRSGGVDGPYTISGRITDGANPLAGVTVSDGTRSATTDSGGNYTINGVPAGSHTVTPTKSGYAFSPASLGVSVPPNATGKDFNAYSQPTYTISGRIVDSTGDPVASVTITDGSGRTTSTDANGNYTMTDVPAGVYTLTPSKSGYTFTPATQIGSVPPNAIDRDFMALPAPTYSVSGRVADVNGDPMAEVTVLDKSGKMGVTDGNGNYTIVGIPKGSYSLTAYKSGYIFNPNPLVGSVPPNATKQNFVGMVGEPTPMPSVSPTGPGPTPSGTVYPGSYSISGTVRDSGGTALSGVTVTDGQGRQVTTDGNGSYLISGYLSGSYNISAAKNGYTCTPSPQLVTIPPSGTANFTCALVFYAVSGSVTDANNHGIAGVTVSAGAGYTSTTDASGAFVLSLPMGSYILTPVKTGFQFSPSSIVLNVTANASGYKFYATSGVTDVIVNGDFEEDGGWVLPYNKAGYSTSEYGDLWAETLDMPVAEADGVDDEALRKEMIADYSTDEVLSGTRSLRVGIVDPAKNVGGYSEARQRFQVPWTSKITKLRFWLYPTGGTPDGRDIQIVSLLDHNTKQKERLVTLRSNASKWQYYEFDLSKYRGQTLWIYFGVYNDGKGSVMGMYVDYVQVLCASGEYPPLPPVTPTLPAPTPGPGPIPTVTPGPPGSFSISGRVTTSLGAPLSGVTVSTSDGRSAVTTATGDYVFSGLSAATYTVTPQLIGATFTPPSSTVTLSVTNPNVSGLNFISSVLTQVPGGTYAISGTIKDTTDTAIGNVTVTDGAGHTTTTNANGTYNLAGLTAGMYTLYAAREGFVFSPAPISVTITSTDVVNQNFTGTQVAGGSYTVSGRIFDSGTTGLAGVTLNAGGGHTAVADSMGNYTITGLTAGSYEITPSKSGYAFTPVSRTVNLSGLLSVTHIDFTAYAGSYPPYSISGKVTLGGVGLEGVSISDGSSHFGMTGSNGDYTLSGFYAGSYTLTAAKEGYTFSAGFTNPVVMTSGNVTGKDFTASDAPSARSNPDALEALYVEPSAKPRIDGDFPGSSVDFPSPTQWNTYKNEVTYKILGIDKIAGQNMYGVWDIKAETLFGWDEQYLYVFAHIYDDVYVQEADDYRFLYRGDSVDIGIDTEVAKDFTSKLLSEDDFRIGLSGATHNPSNREKKMYVFSPASKAGIPNWILVGARPDCEVSAPYSCYQSGPPTNKYIDYTGYLFEAAIEWEELGVTPEAGDHFGFYFSVSDNDQVSKIVQEKALATANNANIFVDPTTWGDLELLP